LFLSPQVSAATQQAQAAQNLAQQYAGYGIQQNLQNLLPIQSYGQFLTQEQQNVFSSLTAKMQAGVQLSQTEMQQLAALQQTAAQSATALGQAGANYAASIFGSQIGQQYKTIGPKDFLVNTGAVPGTQAGVYNPYITGLSSATKIS